MSNKISVYIIDDSAVVRQTVTAMLEYSPEICVTKVFSNPVLAQPSVLAEPPDVIILDIEMPQMDGITFLRWLMANKPIPVIICSSLTTTGAQLSVEALSLGAFEILTKPECGLKSFLESQREQFIKVVKQARFYRPKSSTEDISRAPAINVAMSNTNLSINTTDKVVAIGTSTGGTQALEYIFSQLEPELPGIVVVQHMPANFTKAFAQRLNDISKLKIKEAEHNERVLANHVYIAPGSHHLQLVRRGAFYYTQLKDGPPVQRHKPSVNVLFQSVAKQVRSNAIGFILTGMGADGAFGLLEMKKSGAKTYAQDESSSIVFGMPKEAIKLNAHSKEVTLADVPMTITQCFS
ncbi:chemotaxis response regulator protein-glutamate methylesterase [Pseudoalteromonas sp. DY56-GL79]|uniref:protein-glutamate methylesterase/protein-glutamine glutaminase n=1 Tax=Pseudoalteromonas sp. DY56-GL79 TaxID=2967131 RepID=UPI00352B5C71